MSSAQSYRPTQQPSERVSWEGTIDVVTQSPLWNARRKSQAVLRGAIGSGASRVALKEGELAIVLADDSTLRILNRRWRRQDRPTNVLSFPANGGRVHAVTPNLRE